MTGDANDRTQRFGVARHRPEMASIVTASDDVSNRNQRAIRDR
jgi:hypothetical protein